MSLSTRTLSMFLCILMIASGILPFIPLASAVDPVNTHGHVDYAGNWDVLGQLTYDGATEIHMTGGNVRVKNGGSLTLDHAGIQFSSGSAGQYGIIVETGGTLVIKNGGYLSRALAAQTYHCAFMQNSTISVDSGAIFYAGGTVPGVGINAGCYVLADGATFDKLDAGFNNAGSAILNVYAMNVMIRNSTFNIVTGSGVEIVKPGSADIYDSVFKTPGGPNLIGVSMWGGTVNLINDVIYGLRHGVVGLNVAQVSIIKCNIHNNSGRGAFIDSIGSNLYIKDTLFSHNADGVLSQNGANIDIVGKTIIQHSGSIGLRADAMTHINAKGIQLRFNNNNQIVLDRGSMDLSDAFLIASSGIPIQTVDGASLNMSRTTMQITGPISFMIYAEMFNDLEIAKSDFNGGGFTNNAFFAASGTDITVRDSTFSNLGVVYGLDQKSSVNSFGNTFTEVSSVFSISFGSKGVSRGDVGKQSIGFSGFASANTGSVVEIYNGDFRWEGDPVGMCFVNDHSTCDLIDTKFTSPKAWPFVTGNQGVRVNAINLTSDVMYSAEKWLNEDAVFNIGWHVEVQAQWQNGAPAAGASIKMTDSTGDISYELVGNDKGIVKHDLIQNTYTSTGLIEHNNYNFTAESNGLSGTRSLNISKDRVGPGKVVVMITDTFGPGLSIENPSTGWLTDLTQFKVNGTASDMGSGLEGVYVAIDNEIDWVKADGLGAWSGNVTLTEGLHKINVQAKDVAGLVTIKSINVTVDLTAPDLEITSPDGPYVTSNIFNLSGTTDVDAEVKVNDVDATNVDGTFNAVLDLADGEHNITVEATDPVGNKATAFKVLIIDTVAPTLTTDIANGTWTNKTAITLSGKSDGNFVKVGTANATVDLVNKTWKISLTLAEGANNFVIESRDLAGLKTGLDWSINVDLKAPIITVSSPAGTVLTNAANYTIKGNVKYTTELSVNGNAVTFDANGNFSTTVTLAEGTNTFAIKAQKKGTACFPADSFFDVFIEKETRPPVVEITSPKNGLVTNSASVQVTGKVDDLKAALKFGTANLTNSNGTFTATATLTLGANTFSVTATDLAGNTATATVTVTYDNVCDFARTKPTKASSTSNKDSVTITGTSEPGATVYINDAAIPVNADGSWSYKLILKEGKNTVNMKAVDAAGNEKTDSFSVTYTDARQFEMSMLLIMGILFMIIGLVIGVVVGRVMSKPKSPPPADDDYPRAPAKTKPAPVDEPEEEPEPAEEEKPFTPEEEPEKAPEPSPPKAEPKPEPKSEPKVETKAAPKTEPKKGDDSLEGLLKGLEKKK